MANKARMNMHTHKTISASANCLWDKQTEGAKEVQNNSGILALSFQFRPEKNAENMLVGTCCAKWIDTRCWKKEQQNMLVFREREQLMSLVFQEFEWECLRWKNLRWCDNSRLQSGSIGWYPISPKLEFRDWIKLFESEEGAKQRAVLRRLETLFAISTKW